MSVSHTVSPKQPARTYLRSFLSFFFYFLTTRLLPLPLSPSKHMYLCAAWSPPLPACITCIWRGYGGGAGGGLHTCVRLPVHQCGGYGTMAALRHRRPLWLTVRWRWSPAGWGVRAVSMVSSGTLEGTDWKLDLHELRLTLSAVVLDTFYEAIGLSFSLGFLFPFHFFPFHYLVAIDGSIRLANFLPRSAGFSTCR